ncbi:UvrD-helicase domain-containing protein [Kaistia sp. UC242_56]|uniref:UvrD-helicase domain-containing protein n=1 Tax=Kaistia sp. UC242_56 TaxID=3374625 RepID=UPI00379E132E
MSEATKYLNLHKPAELRKGLLASTVVISTDGSTTIKLKGAPKVEAALFNRAAATAWRRHHLDQLDREWPQIERLVGEVRGWQAPAMYPSACRLASVLGRATALEERLSRTLLSSVIDENRAAQIAALRSFVEQPVAFRNSAISAFVPAELERWKEFFDTIESKPLTPEQRLSIVVDEDATLVLAGAGSGKTSVITAKAAYLLTAGIRPAEEILLLAFAKAAAAEMSERIEARCGIPIEARTFHALAYEIIGAVEGAKPALAGHATDDVAFLDLIRQILRYLVKRLSEVSRAIIRWFTEFLVEPKDEWDFATKHAWYQQVEKLDLRTLQGEQVKSYEELTIANWLFQNGIAYEYEPSYEHKVETGGRRIYTPDFRLIESGVYLEHFGVRRDRGADGVERLVTAPFVDRDEYIAGMTWKRQVHAENQTILIETYSYERQEGRLLEALAEKLAPYVTLNPRPGEEIYDRVASLGQIDSFSRLLGTFLRQFKGGGYDLESCSQKAQKLKLGVRAEAFLHVFDPVYREYQSHMRDRIDFEDMILRAARYAEQGQFKSPYRHILVDEFQDISQSRAKLIKALKSQHEDARIFAVGDDWQSIYRFAGSDIHIMRNFGEEFGGCFGPETGVHRTVDLGRTFRSVDKIALAARAFILKNPAQITKTVVPAGTAMEPAIRVVWTRKDTGDAKLHEALVELSALPAPRDRQTSVLLLGRYRHVDPGLLALKQRFPQLRLDFKTIHASKGLEADHVILLRTDAGRTGFPSEIADDPLLSLVSPEAEPFENAEERRVMYVAMTRARSTLTIMASEARPSAFVQELLENPEYGLSPAISTEGRPEICPECNGRLLSARSQAGKAFYRCEHVSHCGNMLPTCPQCQAGLPVRSDGKNHCSSCSGDQPACPACESGWLVKRNGRYGDFYSCVRFPKCEGKAREIQ